MKKHPLILRCLVILLVLSVLPLFPMSSVLHFGVTPAFAEDMNLSVNVAGTTCQYRVQNCTSPSILIQLLDEDGNVLASATKADMEGSCNLAPTTPGKYRYYVKLTDTSTGESCDLTTFPYFEIGGCEHTTIIKTKVLYEYQEPSSDSGFSASKYHAYVEIYTSECADCNKTFNPKTDVLSYTVHSFQNGVCSVCNYCTHEKSYKEYYGKSTITNTNDPIYHYLETPYKAYCSYCNEYLKDGVESIEEVHQFGGYCVCGYYSCPHDNHTYRYIGVEYGIDGLTNEKQHHVGEFYELYCYDCEEVVIDGYINSENPDLYKTYWENHTFDSNGECIYCHEINPDYSPEAPVPPTDLQVAVGMNKTAAFKGDKLTATASVSGGSGQYKCDWVVTCNGAIVDQTAFDPGLTYVYYANQTGNWKFTAYVTDKENSNLKTVSASGPVVTVTECTHENTTTESIGNPSYKQLNDQQHTVIETVKDVCSNCGAVVKDEYTVTQPENHAFNKENKCTLCGYIVPDETCKHTKTKEVTQTTYNENGICDNDPDRHYRTVYKKRICSDCKEVIENSETTNSKYENHNFDATGKCVCGYTKKSEDTYKKLAVSIKTWNSSEPYQPSVSKNISSVGATAYIDGGSGDYTCEWSAISDNGKSSKKSITTTDTEVSWGVNVYSPGTWKFTITVTDNETGNRVSAYSFIATLSERDIYISLLRKHSKYENPLDTPEVYNMAYDRLIENFSHNRTKEILQIVHDAPVDYRTIFLYTLYDYEILSTDYDGDTSEYIGLKDGTLVNGIFYKKESLNNITALFHEMGHAVDSVVGFTLQGNPIAGYASLNFKNDAGENLVDETFRAVEFNMINRMMDHGVSENSAQRIAKSITSGSTLGLSDEEKKERKNVPDYYIYDENIGTTLGNIQNGIYVPYLNVSDVYGGVTDNYVLGYNGLVDGSGHKTSYWKNDKENIRPGMEFWAHYFSAKIRNDEKEVAAFHSMLTTACTKMDEIVKFLADSLTSK